MAGGSREHVAAVEEATRRGLQRRPSRGPAAARYRHQRNRQYWTLDHGQVLKLRLKLLRSFFFKKIDLNVPLNKELDAVSERGDVAEQPEKLDGADKHQDARNRHVGPPPSAAAARTARLGAPEDEATSA
jgi:hypothetical protein